MKIIITLDVDDVYKDEILHDIVGLELICSDKTAFEYEEFTLKPMPQRKKSLIVADGDGVRFEEPTEFEQGYNACIDEILGEKQ